ncbi:hypothetical protein AHIS1636_18230 [Arthrobacter mangrovi]|uniref:Xylose isomerase-like TIM barrel domain-containing protein n=1 Tax=Arthrobacter mangrovi TaxID=2966350 RepID=A0ABQ5MTT3_9MICC|nr:hypothetical protein AHIS1636_18230 [Arthrobacter mangrovi]
MGTLRENFRRSSSGVRVGTAPDSWGVWNPQDPAQPPAEQYLREVHEAGYHWTELGPFGYLGTDAARLRDQLSGFDLSLSGGTVFTALHKGAGALEAVWPSVREVAALVQSLGARYLIVIPELRVRGPDGAVRGSRTFSVDEWDRFFAGHDELGRRLLEEFGLRQQFHSHAESPVGTYGEVARLVQATNPEFVNLCLDTGHFAYYLGDSLRLIRDFPDRIGYLHLSRSIPCFWLTCSRTIYRSPMPSGRAS